MDTKEQIIAAATEGRTAYAILSNEKWERFCVGIRKEGRVVGVTDRTVTLDIPGMNLVCVHFDDLESVRSEYPPAPAVVEGFRKEYPVTSGRCVLTHHRGIPVAIAPLFKGADFYTAFAERCSAQLDNVISAASPYAPIDYIEVLPEKALIHYRRAAGSHIPDLMTESVFIGSWKPPLGKRE